MKNQPTQITVELVQEMITKAIIENDKQKELKSLARKLKNHQIENGVSLTPLYIRNNISCDKRLQDMLVEMDYKFDIKNKLDK